jgi:hypothetical protein
MLLTALASFVSAEETTDREYLPSIDAADTLASFVSAEETTDREYLPISKVQPIYPRRALSRGMAGWVIVEFTVTEQGTVRDPFVVSNCGYIPNIRSPGECVDSPNAAFDNAALKAVMKFKFKPKVIDGQPAESTGVQNRVDFELATVGSTAFSAFKGYREFYCAHEAQLLAIAFYGFGQQQSERLTKKKQKAWHKENGYKETYNRDSKIHLANFARKNGDQLRKNLYRSNDTRLQQSMSVLTFEQIKESSRDACLLREAI